MVQRRVVLAINGQQGRVVRLAAQHGGRAGAEERERGVHGDGGGIDQRGVERQQQRGGGKG